MIILNLFHIVFILIFNVSTLQRIYRTSRGKYQFHLCHLIINYFCLEIVKCKDAD